MADNIKLETRFRQLENPEEAEKEFLQDVEWFGKWKAFDMWADRIGTFGIASWQGYLKRKELPENYGEISKLDTTSYKNQANILLEGFADFVLRSKAQLEAKEKYIKELEMKVKYLEYQQQAQFKDQSVEIQEVIERVMGISEEVETEQETRQSETN